MTVTSTLKNMTGSEDSLTIRKILKADMVGTDVESTRKILKSKNEVQITK